MSQRNKQPPTDWNAYEHGRTSSFGSLESVPEDDQPRTFLSTSTPRDIPQRDGQADGARLRRKSSLGKRFDSILQMGGPNSIDNFAKSFQRAAGFREITPVRRNSVTLQDSDQEADPDVAEQSTAPNRSLLRQQLLRYHMDHDTDSAVQDEQSEVDAPTETSRLLPSQSRQTLKSHSDSLVPGSLLPSQYATSYGSISSKLTVTARQRASILIMEQEEANRRAREALDDDFKEEPPRIIEQEVRPDGEVIQRIVGESTVPMTVFNSTNVLIGVGILALPLGIKYAGWVLGLTFLTLSALATSYTAKLLARCLDTNTGSSTYGDIAFLAFDTVGRNFVETLFILELTGANVALIILFADSMSSLITGFDNITWKVIIAVGLIPLNYVPFKYLSFTSVIGIFCCLTIVVIIFADGLIKPHAPGSLREISKTYAFPENWATVPLSLGLIMAPWGGHSVFPAVYKDMRHPQKYVRAVRYTYIFTYGLDASMAVLGYLMFGESVMDEVTANILRSTAYPHALSIIIVMLIAVIPITKIPLSNRPMQDTINKKFYIDLRQMDEKARVRSEKSWKHRIARASVGILANLVQLGFAIFFPDFDSLMALLGSLFCFTVCIILPVSFYLKIFSSDGKEISKIERIGCWALILVSTVLALLGTVFAIVPKEKFGISK